MKQTIFRLVYWTEEEDPDVEGSEFELPKERRCFSKAAAIGWATRNDVVDWHVRTEEIELDDSPIPC